MYPRFPAYREYSEARIEANDAVMALLIASRLGGHALSSSAASPDALLPTLFGQIPQIERLNRTSGEAAALLDEAERHLAYMAIPYMLSIHGAFLVDAARMVRDAGKDDEGGTYTIPREPHLSRLDLNVAHEYIAERCGVALRTDLLPLFHLARKIRNRIVHFAGTPGSRLRGEFAALPQDARRSWNELAGRPLPQILTSDRIALGEGEIIAALAISHHLAHEINDLLSQRLDRDYWVRVVVSDYAAQYPERYGEQAQRLRRLRGYARQLYRPLQVTDHELAAAVEERK